MPLMLRLAKDALQRIKKLVEIHNCTVLDLLDTDRINERWRSLLASALQFFSWRNAFAARVGKMPCNV